MSADRNVSPCCNAAVKSIHPDEGSTRTVTVCSACGNEVAPPNTRVQRVIDSVGTPAFKDAAAVYREHHT